MKFVATPLVGAYTIELDLMNDERGGFARTFCKKEFEQIGHSKEFVQFNHSVNTKKGTLRGMHFQVQPSPEIKLIRCVAGKVFDVIVDLRMGSSTFLQWYGTELSRENKRSMYVPEGFAHGFITLADYTELIYHHTGFYTPSADRGLKYNDPLINIAWPEPAALVSEKDNNYGLLNTGFTGIQL